MLLFLLLACPKATPPQLFPLDAPELSQPPELHYDRADDTCVGPEPFLTGKPAPFVDGGDATCGGILIGDDEYADLVHADTVALPWYRAYATECAAGRARDREWAQASFDHELAVATELEAENRTLRRTGPVLFVAGVLLGGGVVVLTTSVEVAVVRP